MPCSNVSSLASSTKSSAYFVVRITYPPILKSPKPCLFLMIYHLFNDVTGLQRA